MRGRLRAGYGTPGAPGSWKVRFFFGVILPAGAVFAFWIGWRQARASFLQEVAPGFSRSVEPLPSLYEAAAGAEEAWRAFPFPVGERLTYSVSWEGIPVGDVAMEVVEKFSYAPDWLRRDPAERAGSEAGYRPPERFVYPPDFSRDVCRVRVTTRSSRWLDAIYKVDDRIETLIDMEGSYPWRYDEYIREGSRRKDNLVEFDQKNHAAYYYRRKAGEKEYAFQYGAGPLADRVQDPLSVTYYARLLGLVPGQRVTITVHADKQDWPTEIEVIGEEKIDTQAGVMDCLVLRPRYEYEGLFIRSSEPRLWVEKQNKFPVKMDVKIALGSVKVLLKEWKKGPNQ